MKTMDINRLLENSSRQLGVFPLPLGLLLLPDLGEEGRPALELLLKGDVAAPLPEAWAFFSAALRGEVDAALDALGEGPIACYNQMVLTADPELFQALQRQMQPSNALGALVQAAGYVHGLVDEPAAIPEQAAPEVLAILHMVKAAHRLENQSIDDALTSLGTARTLIEDRSPIFASQLVAQQAEILREQELERAILAWRDALELSTESRLPGQRAQLWLQFALTLHESAGNQRARILEAVRGYQEALHAGIDTESAPDAYALIQNHLGLAYLSLPMQDPSARLRPGIAVQCFRQALEIYRPETHPELWASTQLNLANALQYVPSSHPQENLVQAVEIYEQLLGFRNKADDPVGYARLLANQANALAHLGMFQPALEKLEEARRLFHWHGEPALAESVLEQVAVIHEQRAREQHSRRPAAEAAQSVEG